MILYSAVAGATPAVLEGGAPAKMVFRLRDELLVLYQECAALELKMPIARLLWRAVPRLLPGVAQPSARVATF